MDYETFLAKVNKNDSTIHKTERSGGGECERIVRLTRAAGYSLYDLEGYSDYPRFISDAWFRGYAGIPMGVYYERLPTYYQRCLHLIHAEGRRHQQGEQQAGVSPEVEPTGQPTGVAYRRSSGPYYIDPDGDLCRGYGRTAVGSTPTNTQSGEEPERTINNGDYVSLTFDPPRGSVVRSTTRTEEVGVSSSRNEREGSGGDDQNPWQSIRRRMERSPWR